MTMAQKGRCLDACQQNRGRHMHDAQSDLDVCDWNGCYPVVDPQGVLTGELAECPDENGTLVRWDERLVSDTMNPTAVCREQFDAAP